MDFISPVNFLFLVLLIPVIFLFFLKLPLPKIKVDSIFIFKKYLKREKLNYGGWGSGSKKWILFFVQVLVVITLVAGLVHPLLKRGCGKNVLLIIDTTASMSISYKNETRLSSAKKKALEYVNFIDSGTKISVAEFNGFYKIIQPLTDNKNLAKHSIDQIIPTGFSGDFDKLMKSIYLQTDMDIVIFTDNIPNSVKQKYKNIHYEIFNGSDGNIAITNLYVKRDSPAGKTEIEVTVETDMKTLNIIQVDLLYAGTIARSSNVSFGSDKQRTLIFELLPEKQNLVGEVRIINKDALEFDNRAYFKFDYEIPVVLKCESKEITKAVIACDNVKVVKRTPEKTDLVVTYGLPMNQLSINVLSIYPVENHVNFVSTEEGVSKKRIEIVYQAHPILENINFSGIDRLYPANITLPEKAIVLVKEGNIPLIIAGENNSGKIVVLNFDPVKSGFYKRISFPILIANIIEWLREDSNRIVNTEDLRNSVFYRKTDFPDIYGLNGEKIYVNLLDRAESITKNEKKSERIGIKRKKNIDLTHIFVITGFVLMLAESILFYHGKKK